MFPLFFSMKVLASGFFDSASEHQKVNVSALCEYGVSVWYAILLIAE